MYIDNYNKIPFISRISKIDVPNPNLKAFIVFEITAFIWTNRQSGRRTWLDRFG